MITDTEQAERAVRASLQESAELLQRSLILCPDIAKIAAIMHIALQKGHTIFALGNGGSAAEAQHFVAELVGRFECNNCLAAQALSTDTSVLTALANDFSFDEVFERQVRALVRQDDIVLCISTSGNSPSVVKAAQQAHSQGATPICLSSGSGGKLGQVCKFKLNVPGTRVCRVQEVHLAILHILCEQIEALNACNQNDA